MPEPGELSTLSGKSTEAQVEWIVELVRRARVELLLARAQLPTGLPGLFVFNHWNANQPGSTLFLPVSNMTLEYINLLFIYLSPDYRFSIVDEQQGMASAGLQKWIDRAASTRRGRWGSSTSSSACSRCRSSSRRSSARTSTSRSSASGSAAGRSPGTSPASCSAGSTSLAWFRFADAKNGPSVPVGRDGVYEAFTPPYHTDMREAVDAFMEAKWSQYGPSVPKPYKEPDKVISQIQRPDAETVELVKDYCQYLHDTYGRFPAYIDPMYQRLTCQAQHVDPDFYAEHYPPGALTAQHLEHFRRWHPELAGADGGPPRA